MSRKCEDKLRTERKYLQKETFDERLSKLYEELLKLNNKTENPTKIWAKDLNRYLTKEDIQMANKHMKSCSTYGNCKLKRREATRLPVRMVRIQNSDDTKCAQGCGATGTLTHRWWERKTVQPLCKTVWWFLTKRNKRLRYDSAIALRHSHPKTLQTYV